MPRHRRRYRADARITDRKNGYKWSSVQRIKSSRPGHPWVYGLMRLTPYTVNRRVRDISVELAPARETLELCTFTSRADESEQVS
jgi:hypothetical protein